MKKTLIAMFALAGMAMADTTVDPLKDVTYVGYFPNNTTALTSGNQDVTFGPTTGTPLTLTSWMVEVQMTKADAKGNALFSVDKGTPEYYGLGFFYWGGDGQYSFNIDGAEKHGDTILSGTNYETRTDGDAKYCINHTDAPLTIRLAYNDGTAYIFVNDVLMSRNVSTLDASKVQLKSGDLHFWTWSGKDQFADVKVTDLSSISKDSKAVTSYIMTRTVPEPATATLSLLALAGLASRRRRH